MTNTSNTPPSTALNKLPIFEPKTVKRTNLRRVHQIRIGGVPVPATEEEIKALQLKLDSHIATFGVKYGFFASLLGEAATYVSA